MAGYCDLTAGWHCGCSLGDCARGCFIKSQTLKLASALLIFAAAGQGHVGSPDIYFEGNAGPYRLFVTVRPPQMIPGVAELEVRVESPGVTVMRAVPLALTGAGAKFAPVPDQLKVSAQDPQFFTGALWMMAVGSWQVRISAEGAQGVGTLSVPVPSAALSTKRMDWPLGVLLSLLGVFLVAGLVAIIGAGNREASLEPGAVPDAKRRKRGRIAGAFAAVLLLLIVWGGNAWWSSDATAYASSIYKPLEMIPSLSGGTLTLAMHEPGWMQPNPLRTYFGAFTRQMYDLTPDHGHLMHLYAIRQPGLDVVYHLHPDQAENNTFKLNLPSMASGRYKLYADIVHANGFPETMVAAMDVPEIAGRPLAGDDAEGKAKPWSETNATDRVFSLPDGFRMQWVQDAPLKSKAPTAFRFRLLNADGSAPKDMELYMGMLGHAAFVKTDGTVFAHVHPNGSAPMAALMLVQPMDHQMPMDHSMSMPMDSALPNEVAFPYGFPSPGRYRIFVQMKHGSTVETGSFDAAVQ